MIFLNDRPFTCQNFKDVENTNSNLTNILYYMVKRLVVLSPFELI